jgi:nicotinamidase-related amidase
LLAHQLAKLKRLGGLEGLALSDFGTRRRHSFLWQEWVVLAMVQVLGDRFVGTSNAFLAMKHGLDAKGTNTHELPMVLAALAVPGGDEIMPLVNRLAERFAHVVLTQDWHPRNQISFASTHGAEPFSTLQAPCGEQVLWPDHCVQGSPGADFHPLIKAGLADRAEVIIRKGYSPAVDSYSAFFENDKITPTGLGG